MDAVYPGMEVISLTDEVKNEKAIAILRSWVLTDAHGKQHPVNLYHPLTKDAALIARLPKPDHWREVAPGSVPPPKPAPKPDLDPLTANILSLEYRLLAKGLQAPKKGGRA